jgi:glycine cleavage system H protein
VVISDLMLPGGSGFDVIELARSRSPATQVIVITGYATLDNAIRSFTLGAFDVIPKPFDVGELLGVVCRALRFRELSATAGGISKPPSSTREERYFLGQHAWALLEPGGSVLFGVAETFPNTLGRSRTVELPEPEGHTLQGRSFSKMSSDEEVYRVWAPLTGQIIALNPRVADETDLIDTDPYGQGWLVRIVPTNLEEELQKLTRR